VTPQEFSRSIRRSYELFEQLGVARTLRDERSLEANKDFNRVALDTSIPYPEVFMAGLRLGQYNFQLSDYSFFQYSLSGEDEIRLGFYPAPYGPEEFKTVHQLTKGFDEGSLDFEAYCYSLEGLRFNPRRPLVRFEHSAAQYKRAKHPAAHLHIGTFGEDRWPSERLFTPFAFALMIARLYFSEHWEAVTEEVGDVRSNAFDVLYFAEKKECPICDVEVFGDTERQQFHLA
jgi:hypothetical protein